MPASRSTAALALSAPLLLIGLLLAVSVGPGLRADCATAPELVADQAPTGVAIDGLTESQLRLARQGVVIGIQRGAPEPVILAQLMAMGAESSYRNLANSNVPASLGYSHDGVGSDHDSVGPHQIRVSIWSTDTIGIAQLMNPSFQIDWFYDQALAIRGVERAPPAQTAQAVEGSDHPERYAEFTDLAVDLYATFAGIDPASLPPAEPGQPTPGCGPDGSGAPVTPGATEFGEAVVAEAERWLGTPYVWGGGDVHGPTMGGFDCSGLTLRAVYVASGGTLSLPHYTQAQQDHTAAQVVAFAERGDLIFFTAPGAADSHHVGIYYGQDATGTDLLLHAPTTGQNVTVTPLSAWEGERWDVRRYAPTTSGDPHD
ncbi:C40 family peptidase [Nocardia puris]|uniref:C40 family peptidase n=1 Tax=Nocardia puris TaxID=208602 RepID=UPI0018934220|nr:C40 family peptidase [Nocardia puris]MBF6215950.1 C40 family peptidase [Nocardia puris]